MNVIEKKIAQILENVTRSETVFYIREESTLYFNSSHVHSIIAQLHETMGLEPQIAGVYKDSKKQGFKRILYRKCAVCEDMFFPCIIALRLSGYQTEAMDYG